MTTENGLIITPVTGGETRSYVTNPNEWMGNVHAETDPLTGMITEIIDPVRGAVSFPQVLSQGSVPVTILSSGTISATGALSAMTAQPFDLTPLGVVQVYCFAQAGLTAGLYYARWSSTTACQLYSNAAGTVALSGITAGAYVGGTTEVTLKTVTMPGGMMGPNGQLEAIQMWGCNNSVGNKTPRVKVGGTVIAYGGAAGTVMTTNTTTRGFSSFTNCNSESNNHFSQYISIGASVSAALSAVNTAADVSITYTGQLAVASDTMTLMSHKLVVTHGA